MNRWYIPLYITVKLLTISAVLEDGALKFHRRSTCNYDGYDLLVNFNQKTITFDQEVYVKDSVLVNVSIGSSLFEFTASYDGRTRHPLSDKTSYNITCSINTFGIKLLRIIGNKAFYSLIVKKPLDYFVNFQHRYVFELHAWSPNVPSLPSKAKVQISLKNYNLHAPQFISPSYFSVSETVSAGFIVGVVQAIDPDGDKVTYIQEDHLERFRTDNRSGVITLIDKIVNPDDKTTKIYELKISAEDDSSSCILSGFQCQTNRNQTIVKIAITDVNKEAPKFISDICGQSIEIQEHTDMSYRIGVLTAVDNDRGDNGRIEFFFPESSSKNNAYEKFRLEPQVQVGSVRNVSLFATEMFDYDEPQTVNTFSLLVFAQDSGRQRRQDKNDNYPIFVVSRWNYQLKNTSHLIDKGSRLFRVIASDKDVNENGRVEYYLKGDNKYFDVEKDTGFVKFKNTDIVENEFPQRFHITAKDCGTPPRESKTDAEVIINLSGSSDSVLEWFEEKFNDFSLNISEKFYSKFGSTNIFDHSFDGTIMFFGYGDVQEPRFYLSPRPEDNLFVGSKTVVAGPIADAKGSKFTSGIRVTSELDAELKMQHYLYMRVEDIRSSQSLVGLCRVNVTDENDQIPFFDSSELRLSLLEGEARRLRIGQVQAFDRDKTFPNNFVRYRFGVNENPEIKEFFSVSENGEILANGTFDREKRSSWYFYIESYDGANGYGLSEPNTDKVAVRVEVIDVNDNPPKFSVNKAVATISEMFGIGQTVMELNCEDPDFDTELQFSIVSGNEDGHFAIRRSEFRWDKNKHEERAEIYVVGRLNFDLRQSYLLTVRASDTQNYDEIKVHINLTSANTHPPLFAPIPPIVIPENYNVRNILTVNATDVDKNRSVKSIHYRIVSKLPQTALPFRLIGNSFSIVKGLDRDPPNGKPYWIVPISAVDEGNTSESLETYALINITLKDVNDNFPYVVSENGQPWVLMENERNPSFKFRIDDADDWFSNNSGPFTNVSVVSSTFQSYKSFKVTPVFVGGRRSTDAVYLLTYVDGELDREGDVRNFTLTLKVPDAGGIGGHVSITVIIGDRNDNLHTDGEKHITLYRIFGRTRSLSKTYIGNVFVEDLDDWDRVDKAFTSLPGNKFFDVDSSGQISISSYGSELEEGSYEFKVDVFDRVFGTAVTGTVDVTVEDITESVIMNAAAIRIIGFTAHSFVEKRRPNSKSQLHFFKLNVSATISVPFEHIKILTVRDVDELRNVIEIFLYVKGFGRRYLEHRLRQTEFLRSSFQIERIGLDLCSQTVCPAGLYCASTRVYKAFPHVIETNRTSLAGVNVFTSSDCVCSDYFGIANKAKRCSAFGGWCRNGGRCRDDSVDFFCDCPFGFDGPRCEALERSFEKNGFAKFKALEPCQPSRLHLEFSTLSESRAGLLLLNGNPTSARANNDLFLAAQIINGTVKVNLGKYASTVLGKNVVDGHWHHLDIEQVGEVAKIYLDQCDSEELFVPLSQRRGFESPNAALFLGGLPQRLRVQDILSDVLFVHEFEGCIRNVIIDGQFLDLYIPPSLEGTAFRSSDVGPCPCRHQMFCDVSVLPRSISPFIPWWIWLLIIAVLITLISALSFALITFSKKRNEEILKKLYPDDDVRETLIHFGDGAGEQDQASFNLGLLKKPIEVNGDLNLMKKYDPSLSPDNMPSLEEFLNTKILNESNLQSTMSDSLAPYFYEGEGSVVGTLSPLDYSVISSENEDLFFDHPAFAGIAHLYEGDEDE